jgi:hypothetical protein
MQTPFVEFVPTLDDIAREIHEHEAYLVMDETYERKLIQTKDVLRVLKEKYASDDNEEERKRLRPIIRHYRDIKKILLSRKNEYKESENKSEEKTVHFMQMHIMHLAREAICRTHLKLQQRAQVDASLVSRISYTFLGTGEGHAFAEERIASAAGRIHYKVERKTMQEIIESARDFLTEFFH